MAKVGIVFAFGLLAGLALAAVCRVSPEPAAGPGEACILFEVFNPSNGAPVFRSRVEFLARIVSRLAGLDYARTGEGWIR